MKFIILETAFCHTTYAIYVLFLQYVKTYVYRLLSIFIIFFFRAYMVRFVLPRAEWVSPPPASLYPFLKQRLFLPMWGAWLCAWCVCNKNFDPLAPGQRASPFSWKCRTREHGTWWLPWVRLRRVKRGRACFGRAVGKRAGCRGPFARWEDLPSQLNEGNFSVWVKRLRIFV